MSRAIISMTIEDAEHFTPEQRQRIVESYPAYEREARVMGIPSLGSGRVFPVSEESLLIEPFPLPSHWPQIVGIDFGWDHPFAAISLAWDRDSDCVYLTREYAAREETPVVHAAALRAWGEWIPVAWPHDGLQHDKGSREELRSQYARHGLNMLPARATFVDGGSGLEAGIMEMLERMKTGRWKVFRSLSGWLAEFRLYHRVDGLIAKVKDDHISASRYAMMMLRHAIVKPGPRPLGEPKSAGGWMG